jgi:transcriptional regulator with XRE-family HTH domain
MLTVRKERLDRKWTLDFTAKALCISISTVHDIEVGRCKPSYDLLVKLEKLFDLPHSVLFAEIKEPA